MRLIESWRIVGTLSTDCIYGHLEKIPGHRAGPIKALDRAEIKNRLAGPPSPSPCTPLRVPILPTETKFTNSKSAANVITIHYYHNAKCLTAKD